jgi:nucleotide-binding universal stress UspA family protein
MVLQKGVVMIKHILLPTDGSSLSERAIHQGIRLAKALDAQVTGFCVIPQFHLFTYRTEIVEDTREQYSADAKAHAERYLEVIERAARDAGVECRTEYVMNDQPAEAIVDEASDRRCDLIAMASHGRSGMKGLLLGSVTHKVLTHSATPVLVYR